MSEYAVALRAERAQCALYGKTARVAAIDAELDRIGEAVEQETAVDATPLETAVPRGRTRKNS